MAKPFDCRGVAFVWPHCHILACTAPITVPATTPTSPRFHPQTVCHLGQGQGCHTFTRAAPHAAAPAATRAGTSGGKARPTGSRAPLIGGAIAREVAVRALQCAG